MLGIHNKTSSSHLDQRARARIYLKVVLPALLSVLAFGLIVYFFIKPHMETLVLDAKRELIRGIGQTGWQMIDNQAILEDLGGMDRRMAQSAARQILRSFRYGPNGTDYFWVVDQKGVVQVNPFRSDLEGHNVLALHDDKGSYFIKKALNIAKKEGEGFITYSWQKGDTKQQRQKLVYVRLYVPWGWVVGTGVYLDDVEAELKQVFNWLAYVSAGVFLGVLLLSGYITMRQVRSEQRRHEAEGALQETLDKYRAVQDAAPNPLVVYDENGKAIYANPAFTRGFGWQPGEILGKRIDFVPPEEMQITIAAIKSVYGNPGSAITFDTRRYNKDRDILDVRISASTYRDIHGKPVGMIVNLADISESKAAERALRMSEERYRLLFESANDAIVIFTGEKIEDCNDQALQLFGYSREQLLCRHDDFLSPEKQPDGSDSLQVIGENLQRVRAGERLFFEWQYYRKDGSLFDVEMSLQYVDLPGGTRFMSILRDVTARKKAEEALKESEEMLRTVINATPLDIICFKDGDGKWLESNKAVLDLLGMGNVDYKGKTNDQLAEFARPEMHEALAWSQASDEKAFDSGGIIRDEINVPAPDGNLRVFDMVKVPLFFPDGRRKAILQLGRDITERVEAERQHKEMESQLRHSQKMEAIGTLAGGIAHDFNNILTAIIGYTEAAMQKAAKGEEYNRGLKVVLDSSFRARDLVKQLLTFSRGREATPQVLDMDHVIGDTMKLVKAVTPSMVEIHTQTKDGGTVVRADPVQMQQIVMNLCTNAIQAMGNEGGVLQVSLDTLRLSEHAIPPHPSLEPGDYVVLEVSDTGPGMDRETAKKIFDPFFTTKPRDKGTGLGLSLVHGIVTGGHGAVIVDSSPGAGATFKVYLPRSFEHPEAPECVGECTPESKGEGTLLLVEDEPLVMRVEQEILESLGYQVVACSSPVEAREIFEDEPARFDLVITDYAMPNMSGLELASSIKETAPNMPVLLCTGYNQDVSAHELKLFGVDQTLMKPFTAHELSSTLQIMLQLKAHDGSSLAVS